MAKNAVKSLGQRLREARIAAGFSQDEIAKKLNYSKQLVSHWETGRSQITLFDAIELQRLYDVDLEWLLTGRARDLLPPGASLVGFASPEACKSIALGQITVLSLRAQQATSAEVSERAFRLLAPEPALAPTVPSGAIITVDPAASIQPGDVVLVFLKATGELLFRRLVPENPGKPAGTPPFTLRADDPDYLPRRIEARDQPVLLGRLVEIVRITSR